MKFIISVPMQSIPYAHIVLSLQVLYYSLPIPRNIFFHVAFRLVFIYSTTFNRFKIILKLACNNCQNTREQMFKQNLQFFHAVEHRKLFITSFYFLSIKL